MNAKIILVNYLRLNKITIVYHYLFLLKIDFRGTMTSLHTDELGRGGGGLVVVVVVVVNEFYFTIS